MDLSAAHLRRLELQGLDDTEVLRTCLSILSRCSSLEELDLRCDTPGEPLQSQVSRFEAVTKTQSVECLGI